MGKSDSSTFPLRLSQAQRKAVAGELPDLAIRLLPDQPNPRDIAFTLDEMKTIASKCEQAASEARTGGVVRNSLHIVVEAARKSYEKFSTSKIHRIRASERLYQLRISLRDITPEIWRRIQVKECTLDKLHERIQTALGWTNSHLHRFRIDNQLYGDPMLMQENFFEFGYEDSTNTQLGGILPRSGERFRFDYDYDFGDSWSHSVLFEGCLRRNRAPVTRCAWRAKERARPRTWAAPAATTSTSRRWPTLNMNGTRNSCSGGDRSTLRSLARKLQPRGCVMVCRIGGSTRGYDNRAGVE